MVPAFRRTPQWIFLFLIVALIGSTFAPRAALAQTSATQCSAGFALWANGQGRDETFDLSGSNVIITGAAHSNADFRISGSDNRITGAVEYVTTFDDGGDNNGYPTPTQVAAAQPPLSYQLADYRPGGMAAMAAEAAGLYRAITGDWDVSEPTTLSGLYYVTGDAKLSASDIRGSFTVVAEGTIDVSGSSIQATPYAGGLLLFAGEQSVGTEVIKLAGSNSTLRGVIYGPGGTVELSGSNSSIAGIIIGNALKLNGSNLQISFAAEYCSGAPTTPGEEPAPPPEPPANIDIGDDDVTQRIEVINSVTFVTIQFTIRNSGGRARDTRLVIDLRGDRGGDDDDDDGGDDDDDDGGDDDDDDGNSRGRGPRFELVDVIFIDGVGFVRENSGSVVVIGLGQNNVMRRNNTVVVSVTYRLVDGVRGDDDDDGDDGRVDFEARPEVRYNDSGGSRAVALPVLVIAVPVPVVVVTTPPPAGEVIRLSLDDIDDRFRITWESRGGLAVFGFPISRARTRGDGVVIQIFERARMEIRGSEVQLGLIAVELGYGRPSTINPDDLDDDDRQWYRPETGHVIGASFRSYWSRPNGLLIFGLPIAPVTTDDDGRESQCFERACMQLFPEFAGTPNAIQLRLLGVELVTRGLDDDDD